MSAMGSGGLFYQVYVQIIQSYDGISSRGDNAFEISYIAFEIPRCHI